MGAIYNVIVNLRPRSRSFRRWFGIELSADNRRTLYIPKGVAHGFMTRTANAEIFYEISTAYRLELAHGLRWDDTTIGIRWPGPGLVISERDAALPPFQL